MLEIDGSQGEGGGQIVRSSVALSTVTGIPVHIEQIRARRSRPGLARQHLTAVSAAAKICQARTSGLFLHSTSLTFEPQAAIGGNYQFDVGTAGSVTLVLQTILPALLHCGEPSSLVLRGGTHNPLAPPFEFLSLSFLPQIQRMGPVVCATLERPGFYPAGGGCLRVEVQPANQLAGIQLLERGPLLSQRVRAVVAHLPDHIARRECDWIADRCGEGCETVTERWDHAHGPGNVVFVEIRAEQVTEVLTGFGQRGVRAEQVAARVWQEAREYLDAVVPVGHYLADQLLLPLGLAARDGQYSTFRTLPLSSHARTHLEILQQFLPIRVTCQTPDPGQTLVTVAPK